MTDKSNREVMLKLIEYFMQQPKEQICRLLASMMIDLNRVLHVDKLGKKERDNLMLRIQWNINELHKFIKDGPNGELKMENMNSDES